MPQQALMIQCCGFILGPRNSHFLGTGSRLGTISSIEKGVDEKPLGLGVRGLRMIRLC